MAQQTQLLTLAEVADRLRCSARTVKRRIADGSLPVVRLGDGQRDRRVPESDLAAWIEARKAPGA